MGYFAVTCHAVICFIHSVIDQVRDHGYNTYMRQKGRNKATRGRENDKIEGLYLVHGRKRRVGGRERERYIYTKRDRDRYIYI